MGLPAVAAELVELTLLDSNFVAPRCVGLAGPFCHERGGQNFLDCLIINPRASVRPTNRISSLLKRLKRVGELFALML